MATPIWTFDRFKTIVYNIAKMRKIVHLCPNNDYLYLYWEWGNTPEEVIAKYCTLEASKQRHGV